MFRTKISTYFTPINKLSKSYFLAGVFICIFLLIFSLIFSFFIWKNCKDRAIIKCKKASFEIERIIEENFKEARNIMLLVGKEISKEKVETIEQITEHLKLINPKELDIEPNYSWTFLDWINPEGWVCANSRQGVLRDRIKVTHQKRIYILDAPKNPWELIVCPPAVGIPSGMWVIPIGMGITDEKGNFKGIISGGINVARINQKMDHSLLDFPVKFLVIDGAMNVVFGSSGQENLSLLARKLFAGFGCLNHEQQDLNSPIEVPPLSFFLYRKIKNSPYYSFVGVDKKLLQNEFYLLLSQKLVEIFCLLCFCLILLFIFWKKQVYPLARLANIASEIASGALEITVPKQSSYEMQKLADNLEKTSLLLKEREKNLALVSSSHQQIEELFKQIDGKNQEIDGLKKNSEQLIKLSHESHCAHERFANQINQKFGEIFQELFSSSTVLFNNLTSSLDFPLSADQELKIVSQIIQNLQSIESLTLEMATFAPVDVPSIVNECVKMCLDQAFLRDIQISVDLTALFSPMYLDEVLFKQIVVSLISKSLFNTINGGKIEILAKQVTRGERLFLELFFKDNGFGLNQEDLHRVQNRLTLSRRGVFDLKSFSFETIKKAIELHEGTMQFQSEWQNGTCVIVSIPCDLDRLSSKIIRQEEELTEKI